MCVVTRGRDYISLESHVFMVLDSFAVRRRPARCSTRSTSCPHRYHTRREFPLGDRRQYQWPNGRHQYPNSFGQKSLATVFQCLTEHSEMNVSVSSAISA